MTPRIRKVLWGLFILAVGLGLFWAYQRYVVGPHAPSFKWVREGKNYELLEPRTIGLVLITPLLLFVIGRSLADLPWQQRILAVLFRVAFIALVALGLARLARTVAATWQRGRLWSVSSRWLPTINPSSWCSR